MDHHGRHVNKNGRQLGRRQLIFNMNFWLIFINGYNKKATKLIHTTLQKISVKTLTNIITNTQIINQNFQNTKNSS